MAALYIGDAILCLRRYLLARESILGVLAVSDVLCVHVLGARFLFGARHAVSNAVISGSNLSLVASLYVE